MDASWWPLRMAGRTLRAALHRAHGCRITAALVRPDSRWRMRPARGWRPFWRLGRVDGARNP